MAMEVFAGRRGCCCCHWRCNMNAPEPLIERMQDSEKMLRIRVDIHDWDIADEIMEAVAEITALRSSLAAIGTATEARREVGAAPLLIPSAEMEDAMEG